jgi:hypothetical protein
MDITPELLAEQGIQGNLILVAANYFVVDTTEYEGRKPKEGRHRLVAYCRCCFAKLAAAVHALSLRAFQILEELVMSCRRCARRIDDTYIRPHRAGTTPNPGGHRSHRVAPSLGIG